MKPLHLRLFALLTVTLALMGLHRTARADTMSDADARQVQAVIVQQFSAFAMDDADSAFETATPAVRETVGDAGLFLALVRGVYPMVYWASSVTFHKPLKDADTAVQLVEIKNPEAGADAKSWLALFALERQPDNSWRISNCVVTENHWQDV